MPTSDDSSQEKTLEPTQRRIQQEQEKGNFARSKDVTTVAGLLAILLFLWLGRDYLKTHMLETARFFLTFDDLTYLTPDSAAEFFLMVLERILAVVLPALLLAFVAGLTGEVSQVGFRAIKDAFEPKWNKLHPAEGFKRIFSLRQFMEGLKALGKLIVYGYVGYITVRGEVLMLSDSHDAELMQSAEAMWRATLKLGFRFCGLLVAFAAFDYWFQRRQYFKKLRMSHQDMKDELKQTEGDPMVKARIRSIQNEIARKRMMQDVPDSDVVVTNPTHYAVAIRYAPEKHAAPVITAKGQNFMAHRIRDLALQHGVPVVENPPVARLLYRKGEVGRTVPNELFKAVAQILASVWMLAHKRGRSWAMRAENREKRRRQARALPGAPRGSGSFASAP